MNLPQMRCLAKYLPTYKAGKASDALRRTVTEHGQQIQYYSILGVMADIYVRAITRQANMYAQGGPISDDEVPHWEPDPDSRFPDKLIVNGEPWKLEIPAEVLAWYGITREYSTKLWEMQARGYSLEQIAKAIETSLRNEK